MTNRLGARPVRHFTLHYLGMVAAMFAGMMVLYPLWLLAVEAAGAPNALETAEVEALAMAVTMSIGMAVLMRWRGHGWGPVLEMCAAMTAGFVVLFPGLWAGVLGADEMLAYGHVLMLVFMLAVMLLRPAEYAGHAHRRGHEPLVHELMLLERREPDGFGTDIARHPGISPKVT